MSSQANCPAQSFIRHKMDPQSPIVSDNDNDDNDNDDNAIIQSPHFLTTTLLQKERNIYISNIITCTSRPALL